ncbi:hypothetical protein ACL02S_09190 [Nocardia sp. 004]|uniref:hypothetical protein n=1 Tax=Nocardia sp. 004 TaxID=3385978 RepID=UPI0039A142B4
MFAYQRLRTMTVVLLGALLTLGSVTLFAPTVTAAPRTPQTDGFSFDDRHSQDTPADPDDQEHDRRAEKTEELGGRLATEIIDLVTGVIKCGLNIATPSVHCTL